MIVRSGTTTTNTLLTSRMLRFLRLHSYRIKVLFCKKKSRLSMCLDVFFLKYQICIGERSMGYSLECIEGRFWTLYEGFRSHMCLCETLLVTHVLNINHLSLSHFLVNFVAFWCACLQRLTSNIPYVHNQINSKKQ